MCECDTSGKKGVQSHLHSKEFREEQRRERPSGDGASGNTFPLSSLSLNCSILVYH